MSQGSSSPPLSTLLRGMGLRWTLSPSARRGNGRGTNRQNSHELRPATHELRQRERPFSSPSRRFRGEGRDEGESPRGRSVWRVVTRHCAPTSPRTRGEVKKGGSRSRG